MRLLIVNADDFGLTDGVNRGVLEGHQRGILTSTTLLANAPAFDSAVSLARSAPRLGVGVHLNLTLGHAISKPSEIASLADATGRFRHSPAGLVQAVVLGRARPREIEREWAAQIEKISRAGIAVTHLDGHKHVHMLPGMVPIIVRLARQFGISAVRYAEESPVGLASLLRRAWQASGPRAALGLLKQHLKARAFSALAPTFRTRMQQANVVIPMHFYGFTETGFLDSRRLQEILRKVPEGSSELMCHPGYSDDVLRQTETRLLGQRNTELEALTNPGVRALLEELGIQLITFRELART
jgi:chitin disaccharide deacetylase